MDELFTQTEGNTISSPPGHCEDVQTDQPSSPRLLGEALVPQPRLVQP